MKYINSFIFSRQPLIRFLRHFLFWASDIVNWVLAASIGDFPKTEFYILLLTMPLTMAATYFAMYYLLPRFATGNDQGKLLLSLTVLAFFMGFVIRCYKFYFLQPVFYPDVTGPFDPWSLGRIIRETFNWLVVLVMAIAIKLLKNKSELQEKNEQLVNERKEAELNFLKAQMHPHFLFNTLNTLYSETIQNTEKAELVVLHLSNLLRFILEECNKPMITLRKEIKVIQDYIALEKLRHGSRLNVTFHVPEGTLDMQISPLIFLPFVENSFKHSLNTVRGQININVDVSLKNETIYLLVENDHAVPVKKLNSHGKGIANIRRQLELLYEKDYTLTIADMKDKYQVSLLLPIQYGHA